MKPSQVVFILNTLDSTIASLAEGIAALKSRRVEHTVTFEAKLRDMSHWAGVLQEKIKALQEAANEPTAS